MRPQRLAVGVWRLEASVVVAALVAEAAVAVVVAVTLAEVMVSLGIILCFQIVIFSFFLSRVVYLSGTHLLVNYWPCLEFFSNFKSTKM